MDSSSLLELWHADGLWLMVMQIVAREHFEAYNLKILALLK